MKNRIAIYTLYDKDGIIDDYIIFSLKELKSNAAKLAVVSNCKLSPESREKISFVDYYFERGDICYDVGAIADCLVNFIGWEQIYEFDELVIMNDSTFGPIYPFQEAFDTMDKKKELDFWGLTARGRSDFDGGEEIYPEHIQLYFYVIRNNLLHSREFREYFESITDKITDFRSAIINYEFMFTKHFSDLGYKWGMYCFDENFMTDNAALNLSPYHYESYTLVKDYRCPLIKRKLFTGDFVRQSYSDRSDLSEVFRYIKNNTEYDTGYIWQYILRNYHMRDIISSMDLYEIINNSLTKNSNINFNMVSITDNTDICSELPYASNVNSDYILVINDFGTADCPYSLMKSRKKNIVLNLATDMSYISKIITVFDKNPQLGILIPPAEPFGETFFSAFDKWSNPSKAYEYYQELGLTVPFNAEKAPIHSIRAFWCRKKILSDKMISLLKNNDDTAMRIMPLVAQQLGYYTTVVINSTYIPNLLKNMYSETENIINVFYNDVKPENNYEMTIQSMYAKKINDFCLGKSKIYIYGAGQFAQKIIKITEMTRKIDGVYVSDINGNSDEVCGHKVNAVSQLRIKDDDYGIIVAVGQKNNKCVKELLNNKNLNNLLILN